MSQWFQDSSGKQLPHDTRLKIWLAIKTLKAKPAPSELKTWPFLSRKDVGTAIAKQISFLLGKIHTKVCRSVQLNFSQASISVKIAEEDRVQQTQGGIFWGKLHALIPLNSDGITFPKMLQVAVLKF